MTDLIVMQKEESLWSELNTKTIDTNATVRTTATATVAPVEEKKKSLSKQQKRKMAEFITGPKPR